MHNFVPHFLLSLCVSLVTEDEIEIKLKKIHTHTLQEDNQRNPRVVDHYLIVDNVLTNKNDNNNNNRRRKEKKWFLHCLDNVYVIILILIMFNLYPQHG